MKILFVNNFRARGGGEEYLRDLLPGLLSRGVTIGLVCRPDTPLVDMFANSGVTVHAIPRSGLRGIAAVFKTAKVIRESGYDIVAVQRGHDIIQSWLGAMLAGTRPPLSYTVQVPEFFRSRFLLGRMKKIVTISRYIRDKIVAFHPSLASRLGIVYYGIDTALFDRQAVPRGAIRKRFSVPPDAPLIGTVGDLWKNQIEFLDAFVLIRREFPAARLALVASLTDTGPADAFRRKAEELGLADALVWTGRLSKQEILSFYADLDIAFSTHRNEGFGIWVLEALAMGTPVVGVNEGGIRDSLEGCPGGVLVDDGPDAMAAAVLRILRDRSLRETMVCAGPAWVAERFDRRRMIDDYLRFFTSLLPDAGTPQQHKGGKA